jgi:hypothetical protein
MALSVAGLLLVRKFVDVQHFAAHHQVGGNLLSIMGTLYAVVLGFVVVNASSDAQAIRVDIATEANSVLNIERYASVFPKANAEEVRTACIEYCKAVVDDEWPAMPQGRISTRAWQCMLNIWFSIKKCEPHTNQEQAFYSLILDNYTQMADDRRMRLFSARIRMSPLLWMVIIAGGVITIVFTYFFAVESLKFQILMTLFVALTLSLNIFLVASTSVPLQNGARISPIAFQAAEKIMELNIGMPKEGP